MKVALLLSGLSRSSSICYGNLNRFLLSKYDVDIYIHTWDISNVSLDEKSFYSELNATELNDLFKPKKIVVENYIDIREEFIKKYSKYPKIEGNPERSMSMFYKMGRCFEMVDENYDVFIRSRMDLMIESDIDIQNLNLKNINIPKTQSRITKIIDGYAHSIPHDSHGVTDCFSIGDYQAMSKYSNVYIKLDELCYINNHLYHPEYILNENLKSQNIKVDRFDMSYTLVRKPNI